MAKSIKSFGRYIKARDLRFDSYECTEWKLGSTAHAAKLITTRNATRAHVIAAFSALEDGIHMNVYTKCDLKEAGYLTSAPKRNLT